MDTGLNRRELLKTASVVVLGASLGGRAHILPPATLRQGQGVSRSRDPDHGRLAPFSGVRFRRPRGTVRRQDGHPQLRPRFKRRVDVVGHRSSCDGRGVEDRREDGCRHRLWCCRTRDRAAPPETRSRGDDLCQGRSTGNDLQHVGGMVFCQDRRRSEHAVSGIREATQSFGAPGSPVLPGSCQRPLRRAVDRAILVVREPAGRTRES